MHYTLSGPRNQRKYLVIGLGIGVLVSGLLVFLLNSSTASSPIPNSIAQKINFSIFYPRSTDKRILIKEGSLAYSSSSNGFSYEALVNSKEVTISEQSSPNIFSQSGVYDYKLSQANEYDSLNTSAGEVDLTRPGGLKNQTVAWLNSKGTLLLARASQTLSTNEWELLFNSMQVINSN